MEKTFVSCVNGNGRIFYNGTLSQKAAQDLGVAVDSIVSAGCIISGGRVMRSVLSPGVRVNSYCEVEYSILMPNVEIGRYSRVQRAIIDTGVKVPESSVIGFDPVEDRRNGHYVTESGIVVVSGAARQGKQSQGAYS